MFLTRGQLISSLSFFPVDLNILDDVISAVDELVASDTNAVSEGLLMPREDDDDDGSHEILSRWDSQGKESDGFWQKQAQN